jgi:hypothetical protein
MSNTLQGAVMWGGPKDPTQNQVLGIIASFCNDMGEGCFASMELIAKLSRRTERTVITAIEKLSTDGWLRIVQSGNGRGHLTRYELDAERLTSRAHAEWQQWKQSRVKALKKGATVSPFAAAERVKSTQRKGEIGALKGEIDVSHNKEGNKKHLKTETQQVMRECHFTDDSLAPVITEALEQYAQTASVEVAEVARLMIRNHADFIKLGPYLRYRWGERQWIKQGHWINVDGWPVDQTRFDRDMHMRVGLQ